MGAGLLVLLALLPLGLLGKPWAEGGEDETAAGASSLRRRVKRGWVWNQFFVLEEYTGLEPLYIGKLHSDMDKGDGSILYILTGEGAGTTFTIDDSTGDIHAIQRLDREFKSQYLLRAQARSRVTQQPVEPESEFIVKIQDINDNEPRFVDGPYSASVPEMSTIGTSVIQVTATDADDPTYGNSARVVYSVLEGQPYFSVDAKTGVVRVSLADMDRETRENYTVVIQAKDMGGQLGGLAGTTTVDVSLSDINDNPPVFDQRLYQMSAPESAPLGTAVGRIWARDRDVGVNAHMSYSIVDGDGRDTFDISTDPSKAFGIITVKRPLDFESKRSYTLKVQGANTERGPGHSGALFTDVTIVHVSVEDVDEPPVFQLSSYVLELPEDAEIGTVIQSIQARDPDAANNTVRYSIDKGSDLEKFFYIDLTTGALMTVRALDREKVEWHNITVLAMEMNNPSQISSVPVAIRLLDVNDNPPSLSHYLETFMCDNAKAGQLIQSVTALDPDEPQGGHRFYYSLSPQGQTNPNFTLRDNQDNSAWILTRRSGWALRDQTAFFLPISVRDGEEPAQTSTTTLTIRVCSCDHQGEVLSCNAEAYTLPANLSRGALIAILACIFVLLILILLMLSLRSQRKKPYLMDQEENVHENIVRYDDEGGGEEDTEAFDIAAMWNPREVHPHAKLRQDMLPEIQSLSRYVPQARVVGPTSSPDGNVHGYVLAKLIEADVDPCAPPYDSLQTYAYEGEGSVAESLSSLQSGVSNADHEYDYLNDWGPRFKKLAEMYGVLETQSSSPVW
ncbi:hypothetical protein NL108_016985 [Boleophthalmus pectinirostris]|uniref:cadherin-20-like n=1 Tax=Boleophthalmus pectinirostris TaxID=150288 RepID=UPI00242AFAD1|nr:cadherin-20-like [Boleophthalmus pectinirostris]KAJ0059971.1 hypothetical protein NL108_016985 [Boleophthalmus pectinirostris]